jgi:hypothetical protein
MELEETQEWDDSDPIHAVQALHLKTINTLKIHYPELQTESLNACVAKAVVDVSNMSRVSTETWWFIIMWGTTYTLIVPRWFDVASGVQCVKTDLS